MKLEQIEAKTKDKQMNPEIVSRAEWLVVRKDLLTREKNVPRWHELLIAFRRLESRGEIRGATQASVRAREAQALGFKKIVMPSSNTAGLEKLLGLRVVGVRSVDEAMQELF